MIEELKETFRRIGPWIVFTAALLVAVAAFSPAQMTVILYKLALVMLAAVLAYLIDHTLYEHVQRISDSTPGDILSAARVLSRAVVLVAIVVGLTTGI